MNRIFQIGMCLLLTALLYGCTIPLSCVLLNNTPNQLTIKQVDKSDRAEKVSTVAPGKMVRLKTWEYSIFTIISSEHTWNYKPESVWVEPYHFTGWGPWTKRVFYAQIEPDGLIYILPEEPEGAVEVLPEQSEGFPLKPLQANEGEGN